jgi:dTDP-4-amino-4,6-dideoxygalactose transaminase
MTPAAGLTRVPFVDLQRLHEPIRDELRAAFERVLANSSFIGGREVEAFEADLAAYVGTTHAVGVGSGTAALQLALMAAGIGRGHEVVLPANTFFATAEAVLATGAVPVLADVDPDTALLDVSAVEAAITEKTSAIIAVHLYGQPAPMGALRRLADREGLFLLEDAAQAIGATWYDLPVGSIGDAAAFSFYPGKNLGALGDAGAVTTQDAELARRVRLLRSHGEEQRYRHEVSGFTERLDALQAAFLAVKLRHLPEAQRARDVAAARYRHLLADVPGAEPLALVPGTVHVHHLMVVRVAERDRVRDELHQAGVEAGIHYPIPIHHQPACVGLVGSRRFPATDALAASILSLPLFAGMADEEVDHCVDVLRSVL